MTDTPAFGGFAPIDATYTRTPNEIFELIPELKEGELKCLLYIVRHTLGYHEPTKVITFDEFINGRKRKDGTRIDEGTGLSKQTVIKSLATLYERGFVYRETNDEDRARIKHEYGLRYRAASPDVKNLDIRGQKSGQRSEKETLEMRRGKNRNPRRPKSCRLTDEERLAAQAAADLAETLVASERAERRKNNG